VIELWRDDHFPSFFLNDNLDFGTALIQIGFALSERANRSKFEITYGCDGSVRGWTLQNS
jgi:hypothetical protein